jgi:hypothetical protein
MSDYETQPTNYSQKNYSPESTDDFDPTLEKPHVSTLVDEQNITMKTPQSLDDLLDIDDNNNRNEDERPEEHENDDDDSTRLSMDDDDVDDDDAYTTDTTKQKKTGKPEQIVK